MPTKFVTKSNRQFGTIVEHPVTIMAAAATTGYAVDLPPGAYEISMVISASLTGTTTTIGTIRPYANAAQTVVTNQDISVVRPSDSVLSVKSVSFPAASVGKIVQLSADACVITNNLIKLPFGFRFVVTKGGAATNERFEVTVVAAKRA